jgi:predicted GNAT family acetyltransferase
MSEVTHKEEAHRFELEFEDVIAYIEYKVKKPKVFAFVHTKVPDAHKGKGIASQLTKGAFEWCKEQGVRIIPVCPFIVTYIERHPEWKVLLYESQQ